MRENYSIFEEGSEYWKHVTDNGRKEVPTFFRAIVKSNGIIIEEKKHPVIPLEKGKWMINYNKTI